MTDSTTAIQHEIGNPPSTRFEVHGIDCIPDTERSGVPRNLFLILFGGVNSFPTIALGAFPVLVFGLSFWSAALAILLGTALGGALVAPMAIFGALTGTNNAVSSGAHFGIVGRLIGTLLAILTSLTFFTLAVYTSGDILAGLCESLLGMENSIWLRALIYGILAALGTLVGLYGFHLLLAFNRFAMWTATPLLLVATVGYSAQFDPNYAGVVGSNDSGFAAAFVGSFLLVLASPLSFGPYLGDWSRYIPRNASRAAMAGWTLLGQIASSIPLLFGAMTAVVISIAAPQLAAEGNYVGGLLAVTKGYLVLPIVALALVTGVAAITTLLYGPGLDFSAVVPGLSRFHATLIMSAVLIGVVYAGLFSIGFVSLIILLATLLVVCTTTWCVIMAIGLATRRMWYDPEALQVFNRRQTGGIYWFKNGYNWRAVSAWAIASTVGLLAVNIADQFEGPIASVAVSLGVNSLAGIDLSLVLAILLAATLYLSLLFIFPEPRSVFGSKGPWLVPAIEAETQSPQPLCS